MIGVTAFGIFLTPVFYVVVRRLSGNRPLRQAQSAQSPDSGQVAEHLEDATTGP
jgi:multidrug efflux pump